MVYHSKTVLVHSWQNMISGETPKEQWVKTFRMTCKDFFELVRQLQPHISLDESSPNYRSISAEKKVAVTLYYLKDMGSMATTANTFGIAINTASCLIHQVCNTISNVYKAKFGMVQAFGCIDGTHVPIKRPVKDPQDYYCYKGFYLLLQRYIYGLDCRWPGSVHDAKVFAKSSISHKLREQQLPQTFQMLIPGLDKIPNYLIGDPAYPVTPYCMKEFEKTVDINTK